MAGAIEKPFNAGQYPMTLFQWEVMADTVAQLCHIYQIPIASKTVLGHGEVERVLGVKQFGKWDPMVIPWESHLSSQEVGSRFRALVRRYY